MPASPTSLFDEIGIATGNLAAAAGNIFSPTIRLGVTGLSRAGKTIFITSLVNNLIEGGRLPLFSAMAEGRLVAARLAEQPDSSIPRFAYEKHLAALRAPSPEWPESTRRISQLRLEIRYQSALFHLGASPLRTLNLDIIDYPGEWLLDLPLLSKTYAEWSAEEFAASELAPRDALARPWREVTARLDPDAEANEPDAEILARAFTEYLLACRADEHALSTLPPGRFLMPGDLEGSPALTFAPLPAPQTRPRPSSLYAMLERRFEAYKNLVVRPFFRAHFAKLDRQIVLVDALAALNAGPRAVSDLEAALADILSAFRPGGLNIFTNFFARRIDRILFAATKADHLHHTQHDRLERILGRLVEAAARRAKFAGANTRALALAAIRATREARVEEEGEDLPLIVGVPQKGEKLDGVAYDGKREIAFHPGDLPEAPDALFDDAAPLKFLRFRPPRREPPGLPHIRLDRAMEFLIGDRMR